MYNKLVFYCATGAGDLFESREFVKDIMSFIPANEYYYAHNKNTRIFFDIPKLRYMKITPEMGNWVPYVKNSDNLYLNCWIGKNSKYVLSQVGCVIDKNYEMFNDTLREAGHQTLSKQVINYLPTIDFSTMETSGIDLFVKGHANRRKVLVCNGKVKSLQANNFDFAPVVLALANNHKDTDFIVASPIGKYVDNVYLAIGITQVVDGFDLNEISYLAKFVDVIIGRKSGPFTFAHNKDVWYSNKKSLSFTYAEHSSHFVQGNDLPLRKYWSPAETTEAVIRKIEGVLDD